MRCTLFYLIRGHETTAPKDVLTPQEIYQHKVSRHTSFLCNLWLKFYDCFHGGLRPIFAIILRGRGRIMVLMVFVVKVIPIISAITYIMVVISSLDALSQKSHKYLIGFCEVVACSYTNYLSSKILYPN